MLFLTAESNDNAVIVKTLYFPTFFLQSLNSPVLK